MPEHVSTPSRHLNELDDLRARLADAEETIGAIRNGQVDALLIVDEAGERVYTLRSADAPYRALVEQMHEGAVSLTVDGDIIYANEGFARLVGLPLEQVIGSCFLRFLEKPDHRVLEQLLRAGAGTLRTGLRTTTRSPLDAHISVSHVRVDDLQYCTLIVTDMTTLAKVQRESRSKDEFLAMLAHELRNPLAPIRTGLQVLRLAPSADAAERTREMMERQIAQMVRLIDDLLDVSRVSRGKIDLKKELIDLRAIISLAIETSLPLVEAGRHHLSVHVASEPLPVEADPTRLAQVFSNLLNNAAKYTPEGGRLELEARREQDDVLIAITDNGVGIPGDMLPEVFEMFSQVGRNLDRAQGGLGIGLTLVRRLTEMHGGTVTAQSRGAGTGSTFSVRIPLAPSPSLARRDHAHEPARPASAARRLRVLVVDDNVDGAQALALLIAVHAHETVLAHNGPDALRRLADFRPHLAIIDIGLPGLSGYDVAQRMRLWEATRDGRPTFLVALTGWGSEEDKARSLDAGFDLHLTKPVDPREVEALLARLSQQDPAAGDRAGASRPRPAHPARA